MNSILISKEYFAKELIKNGYIDSYIDFFYLGWGKTPNLKKNFQPIKINKINKNQNEKLYNNNILHTVSNNLDILPNQKNKKVNKNNNKNKKWLYRFIYRFFLFRMGKNTKFKKIIFKNK